VLFSDEKIAAYINDHFEPAWQSVRPVPMVTIDFGNGTVIRRTLHGNVATYVTLADGRVLDVLPGVYDPRAYLAQLGELANLHLYARQARRRLEQALKAYHQEQAGRLGKGRSRVGFTRIPLPPGSIFAVEGGVRVVLQPAKRVAARGEAAQPRQEPLGAAAVKEKITSTEDLAEWKLLAEDTRLNESVRRKKIHEKLIETGPVEPEKLTKWLYRDVLHADLDDPYLGLGKVLFGSYPFTREDGQ